MSAVQLKRLETKINKLTALVKLVIDRDVVDVAVSEQCNRTARAAAYVGVAAGTLAVWRTIKETPGPRFTYSGTTPVYSKKDLDEWLATRSATGKKRNVGINVGRSVGTGKKRAVR